MPIRLFGYTLLVAVIPFIPFHKLSQSFPEGDARREAEVFFKRRRVGIGCRNVSGLHRDKLLVRFEVVVLRQDTSTDELFLEDVHEIQQILRLAATDVLNRVWRDG